MATLTGVSPVLLLALTDQPERIVPHWQLI
jgi:hypothetical protein